MNRLTFRGSPSILSGALLGLSCALAASAQIVSPAPGQNAGRAAEFLARLKQAVDAADRRTVATMVTYPMTVLASGFNIPVRDAAAFIRLYDSVVTPELRCAIVGADAPTSTAPSSRRAVTITPDGLSMFEGAIWAPLKDGRYRIARIRVLPAAPSVEGRKGLTQVTFAEPKGERSATFAGWLVRRNVDVFAVTVKKGETLQARIDGFRGHDATLAVSPRRAAETASASLPDVGRLAAAKAAADGEYRVEVAALAPYCDPPQRYKLTITVR